ncbi:MAG TPA: signal peptidase I [Gemmatimonadaceae bacterium]|nr:signal peptidase I [Gemmatimonadaceae bacterium]
MAVAPEKKSPRKRSSTNVVSAARRESRGKRKFDARELLKSLAIILAIWFTIRTLLVEPYRIPSESMEPTLLVGDFLFVNKLIYGPHIPFTNTNLPGYGDPKRGSIAVYVSPPQYDQPEDLTPTVVKRLVGIPGDTLYMRDGVLFVNGIAQRQGFGTDTFAEGANETNRDFDWQKKVVLQHSRFGPPPAEPTHDNWGPFVVPPDHYFGMGDNRYHSKDARYYGFVPRANLRGKPMFIYISFDWYDWRIRWNRIGHVIR